MDEVPNNMEGLEDLSIFNKDRFDKIKTKEIEIMIRGDAEIKDNERLVLGMHPKFSVVQKLTGDALDLDEELAFAKTRMQITKENDEKVEDEDAIELTEEEQERYDEMDAECRQIFDPVEKVFDNRKRRVTDLKECSRVTLPKPMKEKDEALIEIRRDVFGKTNCKKDLQESNLSKDEMDGL